MKLCYVLLIFCCLVLQTRLASSNSGENLTVKLNRERKARLVKKYMNKHGRKEGSLRLVGGSNHFEGNVEILHFGKWGSICDDEWDLREAAVVCRQLGYDGVHRVTHSSMFGRSRRRYWMDNLYCTGEEKELSRCRFDGWGNNDCAASEAAGVVCNDPNAVTTTTELSTTIRIPMKAKIKDHRKENMKLRLVGGRVKNEGRVEVKFGDKGWGLICGDGWSLFEAMVVCRELGYGFANDAVQTDYFGGHSDNIILSGVKCNGTEENLSHCLHDAEEVVTCPGKRENIASVVCTHSLADLVIDHIEIMRTAYLEDRQLYFLQCAMEENCLASEAYRLQSDNVGSWHLETRRLLRFTARILNAGTADFRPMIPKHLWEFHQCHMHYHSMEVFATFDVIDSRGKKVAEGHKASFCLEDNQCMPGVKPVFACANFGDQGISVNCSDIYKHNIDCQWIDISELVPGHYTMKVAVNPEFKVAEMSFDNNAAVCQLYYTESFVQIHNCTVQRP